MKTSAFAIMITLISSFLFGGIPAFSDQPAKAQPAGNKGYLELECNIIGVDLHLCPRAQFERKTTRWFFGLLTSSQESCTREKLFLGTTPLKRIELTAGSYVLLIPPDYAWEHKGPIEVSITARQKTFFLLKLFKRHASPGNGDRGDPGGASSGAGTGGAPGASPP